MEILEIPEEDRPITMPPVEEPAAGEDFVETIVAESTMPLEIALGDVPCSKVDSPVNSTLEVSSAEIVATEFTSHMETVPATTISTGVTTADTSVLQVMIV